jgi:hypothetical protein
LKKWIGSHEKVCSNAAKEKEGYINKSETLAFAGRKGIFILAGEERITSSRICCPLSYSPTFLAFSYSYVGDGVP